MKKIKTGNKDGSDCRIDILKEKYTLKKPSRDSENFTIVYSVWLKIGNQSFRLNGDFETADEAEWMREMLAKALMNFELDTDKFKITAD